MLPGRVDTAVPGVERTANPSCVSRVWNMETPPGSSSCKKAAGRPIVSGAEFPGGTGCPRSKCRWPKGTRKAGCKSRLPPPVVSYNWPDTRFRSAGTRKRADVGR
jgi:hypothetical protein